MVGALVPQHDGTVLRAILISGVRQIENLNQFAVQPSHHFHFDGGLRHGKADSFLGDFEGERCLGERQHAPMETRERDGQECADGGRLVTQIRSSTSPASRT